MNIQNTAGEYFDENTAHDPHKAGKYYKRDLMFPQDLDHLAIEVFPRSLARRNTHGFKASRASMFQAGCAFDITDDNRNFRVQLTGGNVVGDRVEIGAAAGKENAEPTVGRLDLHFIDGCALSGLHSLRSCSISNARFSGNNASDLVVRSFQRRLQSLEVGGL